MQIRLKCVQERDKIQDCCMVEKASEGYSKADLAEDQSLLVLCMRSICWHCETENTTPNRFPQPSLFPSVTGVGCMNERVANTLGIQVDCE